MSLEAVIEEQTNVMREHMAVMRELLARVAQPSAAERAFFEDSPALAAALAPVTHLPPAVAPAAPITYDAIKARITRMAGVHRERIKDALAEMGHASAKTMVESEYPRLWAFLDDIEGVQA